MEIVDVVEIILEPTIRPIIIFKNNDKSKEVVVSDLGIYSFQTIEEIRPTNLQNQNKTNYLIYPRFKMSLPVGMRPIFTGSFGLAEVLYKETPIYDETTTMVGYSCFTDIRINISIVDFSKIKQFTGMVIPIGTTYMNMFIVPIIIDNNVCQSNVLYDQLI